MKIANIDTIKTRIKIQVPGDFGKKTNETLELEWKKLDIPEVKDIFKNMTDDLNDENETILNHLINVNGLFNEDGSPAEYSHDVGEWLLSKEYISAPIKEDFFKTQVGKEALKQKN